MEHKKMDAECLRSVVDAIMQTVAKSHPESSTNAKVAADYAALAFFMFADMGLHKLPLNERVAAFKALSENLRLMSEKCAESSISGLLMQSR